MVRTLGVFLAAALLGYGATRLARPPRVAARTVAVRHAPPALRCVDVADPFPDDDACAEARDELAACGEDLAEVTAERPTTRIVVENVPEAQQAGPWTDTLTQALADCAIPGTLEVTDCDEFPCAAAMRIPAEDRERARTAWDACPALQALHLDFQDVDVHCPDGTVETAQVVLSGEEGDWAPFVEAAGGAAIDPGLAIILGFGRREESVLQMWGCNVRSP